MMNKTILSTIILFGACLSLSAHAADIRVLVTAEHAGPDIVYRYTLVNNGLGKMKEFAIGLTPVNGYRADNLEGPAMGTLTQLPTGTTYAQDPSFPQLHNDTHVANTANVTSPVVPAGWDARISGTRDSEAFAIAWKAPMPVYLGPVNVTGVFDFVPLQVRQFSF